MLGNITKYTRNDKYAYYHRDKNAIAKRCFKKLKKDSVVETALASTQSFV